MFSTLSKELPKLTAALSGSRLHALSLYGRFVYALLFWKCVRKEHEFKFIFSVAGKKVAYFMRSDLELLSMREVFVDNEYSLELSEDPEVIVDLGAHIGDSILYFANKYPSARIIGVEAARTTFAQLERNTAQLDNIRLVQVAVADETKELYFHENESNLGSSLASRSNDVSSYVVEGKSMKDLFSMLGIERADIVKFDIEGAEEAVFSSIVPKDFANNYVGELHIDLGVQSVEKFSSYFSAFSIDTITLSKNRRYIFKATAK